MLSNTIFMSCSGFDGFPIDFHNAVIKVPLLLIKGLIVFQKGLLDLEPSPVFSSKNLFLVFLIRCYIYF